jgi:predicted esterase
METHHLETPRTARYHTRGDPERCSEVWFLLHGYGQTAADMLASCAPLASDGRLLVAPEALSRFYLRGGAGPVGASWMTRDDREREIRDTLRWLDGLAAHLARLHGARRTTALGFSQGAAAAWRWALLGTARIERIVAWGGALPADVDLEQHRQRLEPLRVEIVRGAGDAAYDLAALERDLARLAELGRSVDALGFDGGHRLDDVVLADLGRGA